MKRVISTMIAACLPAACTFEPGGWFATLDPALSAAFASRADRDAGGGWQRLSSDYQVRVGAARLTFGELGLLGSTGRAATSFDPARPPPGYSLCHNGHCHSDDGRLVPYAEIEAQLGGGAAGLRAVVTLPVEGPLDLLAAGERPLACKPSCNLDRVTIVRATAPIAAVALEGMVRDGRNPPRLAAAAPFRWSFTASPATADAGASPSSPTLDAELRLAADREQPPAVTLRLRAELSAALFDGVDFAALGSTDGALDLGAAANRPAEERLLANLREGKIFTATISRSDR